jgi:hypothetical protein
VYHQGEEGVKMVDGDEVTGTSGAKLTLNRSRNDGLRCCSATDGS